MGHASFVSALAFTTVLGGTNPAEDDSVLVAALAIAEADSAPGPRVLTDVLVIGATTGVWTVLNPAVREGILREASIRHITDNFRRPIRRAIEGGRDDQDPFTTNYVAHPISWGMLGLYLKERGYSNASALVFTQAHSVVWEYVIEGAYMKPSGKDLIANVVGATLAIYVVHGLSEAAAERPNRRLHHLLLASMNPFRPFRSRLAPWNAEAEAEQLASVLSLDIAPLSDGLGIGVRVTW